MQRPKQTTAAAAVQAAQQAEIQQRATKAERLDKKRGPLRMPCPFDVRAMDYLLPKDYDADAAWARHWAENGDFVGVA